MTNTVIRFLMARRIKVEGYSMYPTLHSGDCVLFDRLVYRRGDPKKMDIVLIKHPVLQNMMMIKRIVGQPGVSVINHMDEFIVDGISYHKVTSASPAQPSESKLQDDEYFVVGDYMQRSIDDSRTLGPLPRRDIKARAWLVYWPPSRWHLI